jgi:hypothetical protein
VTCILEIEFIFSNLQESICGEHRIGFAQDNVVVEFLEQVCTSFPPLFASTCKLNMAFDDSFCVRNIVSFLQVLFPLLEDVSNGAESGFTCRLQTLIDNTNCCKQKNLHEFSIGHIFGEVFVS